ncbi:hypothetical protein PCANC_23158 [Puccinia coronata f. sp. avenae]|uniref:Uncharacterized protein n=1 Tax=Puccinia coronata f. sp. avenae TaxID=200324 RepID=A0A2N5S495_9BASI|nr:hypothetical protein PCASD_24797 [Puccinia coronata f. sp. avenae]PLW10462.1 hypothetical protein PCANC_23158 [Puccinia coronata f. sp. avenae]
MARPSNSSPPSRVFGLPPRPVQSYQPANRRRAHKKNHKLKDQENQRADLRAPRFRNNHCHHQPLADASNMSSLQYHPTTSLAWNLPSKPSFLMYPLEPPQSLFTPISHTPNQRVTNMDSMMPFHLPHFQPLRTVQVPQVPPSRSSHPPGGPMVNSELKTNVTPRTRRKLAVEGMRKAVSDAALRKMGIHAGGLGWGQEGLDQPISFTTEKPKIQEAAVDTEKVTSAPVEAPLSPESNRDSHEFHHASYSPRQYTPKPLLLPCKLARSSNPTRSPPPFKGPLFSRQRTISYHRSPSIDLGRQIQPDTSISDDGIHAAESLEDLVAKPNPRCSTVIEDGSTTPSDCSFASDAEMHFESTTVPSSSQVGGGSTTPCDSSFQSDHVMEISAEEGDEEEEIIQSHEASAHRSEATEEEARYAMETDRPLLTRSNKILDALVWTIAAPQKRAPDARRHGFVSSAARHPDHRKSVGYWLGASLPKVETKRHHRASSEIVLVQRNAPNSTHALSVESYDRNAHHWTENQSPPQREIIDGSNLREGPVASYSQSHANGGLQDSTGLNDTPVAHPTFILPHPDTHNGLYNTLKNLSSPPSLWSPLLRRMSSFSL